MIVGEDKNKRITREIFTFKRVMWRKGNVEREGSVVIIIHLAVIIVTLFLVLLSLTIISFLFSFLRSTHPYTEQEKNGRRKTICTRTFDPKDSNPHLGGTTLILSTRNDLLQKWIDLKHKWKLRDGESTRMRVITFKLLELRVSTSMMLQKNEADGWWNKKLQRKTCESQVVTYPPNATKKDSKQTVRPVVQQFTFHLSTFLEQ